MLKRPEITHKNMSSGKKSLVKGIRNATKRNINN